MRGAVLGLSLLASAACPVRSACAWSHERDEPASWRSEVRAELHLPVRGNLGALLRDELEKAAHAWNDAPCPGPGMRFAGMTDRLPDISLEGADGHTVIGFEERAWPYGSGVTALTRVRAHDGVIYEADMLLNAVDFEWQSGPVPRESRRLRQLAPTLLHELGHLWGLGHSISPTAAMHESELQMQLGPDDREGMCSLYTKAPPPAGQASRHEHWGEWALAALFATASGAALWCWRVRRRWRCQSVR
jgi:hypothetical protein